MPCTDERRAKKLAYAQLYKENIIEFEQKWTKFLAEGSRMNKNPQVIADEFIRRWSDF